MTSKKHSVRSYAMKASKIAVFGFAIFLIQSTVNAQTALEQQCHSDVQGKVAWNRAGSKSWNDSNLRNLCQGTINPSRTISCFQEQINGHDDWNRGINACKSLHEAGLERLSYDSNSFVAHKTVPNQWTWSGPVPFERTIYNPLDGGVLLKYRQNSPRGNSDGCSSPTTEPWRTRFRQACFAHDQNYDAPFALAGFPSYASDGSSTGKDLADYLFLKDILYLGKQTLTDPERSLAETAAFSWFRAVQDFGGYRGRSDDQEILEKGGVVAVKNYGVYTMRLRVKWTSPQGAEKVEEVLNVGGRAATIPLSIGARNIEVEAWAVGGKQIFRKSLPGVGMYAYTVGGTTLNASVVDGLKADFGDQLATAGKQVQTFVTGEKTPAGQRAIKFNNQAGYVAEMAVVYFVNENLGGVTVPMAKALSTPKITAGFTRPLIIPYELAPNMPITVSIRGVATTKDDVFSTNVPMSFTGELCFKAFGTIFSPQGSAC